MIKTSLMSSVFLDNHSFDLLYTAENQNSVECEASALTVLEW